MHAAGQVMGKVNRAVYVPNDQAADAYDALYDEYSTLHDYFGLGGNAVMHRLKAIKRSALRSATTVAVNA